MQHTSTALDLLAALLFEFDPKANKILFSSNPAHHLPLDSNQQIDIEKFYLHFSKESKNNLSKLFTPASWGDKEFSGTMHEISISQKKQKVCSVIIKQIPQEHKNKYVGLIINTSSLLQSSHLQSDINELIDALPKIRKLTHDINNKFQIITGFGSVIEDESSDPEVIDCMTNIMSALEQAIELSKQLRSYFPPKTKPEIYNKTQQKQKKIINNSDSHKQPDYNQNILVIDDEPMVQRFLCEMIKRLKYEVDGVENATNAISSLKEKEYSLAILDMNLPDMPSDLLFDKLRKIQPNLKIILISGEEMNKKFEQLINKGAAGFIQKPTSVKKLSEIINKVLNTDQNISEKEKYL